MSEKQRLRILVVDDEKPARRDIHRMLAKIEGLEVAGEASDGLDAVKKIKKLRPDLVLLDIQMPGLGGFQVIAKLRSLRDLPSIVFITAYDQYALKAFEVHAVDYLLKPVDEKRLAKAIDRVKRIRGGLEERPDLEPLLRTIGALPARFAVRKGDALVMTNAEDILYVTLSSGEVLVVTGEFEGTCSARSLEEFEKGLPQGMFVRVHRSYLANLNHIHEIRPWMSGSYRLRMGGADGPDIPLSRARARELRSLLKW